MRRRQLLSLLATSAIAGCSEAADNVDVPDQVPSNGATAQLGDTIEHDDITVTPTEYRNVDEFEGIFEANSGKKTVETISAPDNATIGLVSVTVENNDIEERDAPIFSYSGYQRLTQPDDQVVKQNENDIILRAGDEYGHIPDMGSFSMIPMERMKIDDNVVPAYPPAPNGGVTAPIDADSTLHGWVFSLIPKKTPVELVVTWGGRKETWTLKSE